MKTEYNGNGRVKKVSEPYRSGTAIWIQTDYDVLGRPVTVTNPDSSDATFSYVDNTVTQTDEAGNQRRYTSNALGQLTKVEEPNPDLTTPLVTNYSYYVFGPLHQVTQTGSLTRTFTADWLGRTTSESHPENGTTTYTYDGGLVATRTDSRSTPITTTYEYDDIGRLKSIDYTGSTPDVIYTYDVGYTGLLTSVLVSGVTSSSFTYDDGGQLFSEAVTRSGVTGTFTTSYTYDLAGRLLTETYPSERVVTHSYAVSGAVAGDRLAGLTETAPSIERKLLQSTQSNAAGMITNRTLSGGITESRSFNPRNQLTHISAAANSATLLDMGYGYGTNNNGKIRTRNDAVQPEHSASYTFDEIGRLKEVSGGDSSWGITYTLDAYGNRTAQTPSGLANGPTLSQSIGYTNNKNNGYTYDGAGNVIYDGTDHYCYDAENRLTELDASCDGSGSIQYAYDGAGRRIRKLAGGVTTHYFYGLTGLMSEFSTSTTLSSAAAASSTDRVQYRVGEQTGTAVMLVAADGTARENNRVFPFGEPWNSNSGSDNNEKFTTYQRDGETDLDYAMARYYASRSGRFLSTDPGHAGGDVFDPQSWNGYSYALNDSILFMDPTGMCSEGSHEPSDEERNAILEAARSYTNRGIIHDTKGKGQYDISNGVLKGIDCSGLCTQAINLNRFSNPFTTATMNSFYTGNTGDRFRQDTGPRVGNIILYPGHVGIVSSVNPLRFIGSQSSTGPADSPAWKGTPKFYVPCIPNKAMPPHKERKKANFPSRPDFGLSQPGFEVFTFLEIWLKSLPAWDSQGGVTVTQGPIMLPTENQQEPGQ